MHSPIHATKVRAPVKILILSAKQFPFVILTEVKNPAQLTFEEANLLQL